MIGFLKTLHEINNADKLKNTFPHAVFHNMCHHFAKQKTDQKQADISEFLLALEQKPFTRKIFDYAKYTDLEPQKQILLHGIMFKNIYDVYLSHFKKSFDNVLLSNDQDLTGRITIDFIEYNKLPKLYRGLFTEYDKDTYAINMPHKKLVITYNKKNRKKLEDLLLRAKMLIPVIYKEDFYTIFDDKQNKSQKSISKLFVKDEQLKTIKELNDIFIKISEITLPIAINQNQKSNAKNIYQEYIETQNRKNIFVRMNNNCKKIHQEIIDYLKIQMNIYSK